MVVVTPWTTKLPLISNVPVLSPCPLGSIVNKEGTYNVEPPIVTLPDTSNELVYTFAKEASISVLVYIFGAFIDPATFNDPHISTLFNETSLMRWTLVLLSVNIILPVISSISYDAYSLF